MPLSRTQKEEVVEKLANIFSNEETIAFVNFHGLGVSDTTELRSTLEKDDVSYLVAKKSLIRRVLETVNIPGEQPDLEGEIAIAYGKETQPARGVYEFGKAHSDTLSLLGGIFGGRYIDKEEIDEIAQIPSLDVLRGMFVNLINSPIQRFAIALNQIAEKKV